MLATMDTLLESARVLAPDEDGNTPLHLCNTGTEAELLVRIGMDPNRPNKFGSTPLHWAVYSTDPVEVARVLLDNDADVNRQNNEGETPLHRATGRLVQLLLSYGADPTIQDNGGVPADSAEKKALRAERFGQTVVTYAEDAARTVVIGSKFEVPTLVSSDSLFSIIYFRDNETYTRRSLKEFVLEGQVIHLAGETLEDDPPAVRVEDNAEIEALSRMVSALAPSQRPDAALTRAIQRAVNGLKKKSTPGA